MDRSSKIAALVSGGVDSSAALFRLKEEGFRNITAFYLKIWLEDELAYLGSCPWEEDLSYAREVCEAAEVPLKVIPLQREYFDRVVGYAIDELKEGRTPSPDVMCNQRIKFSAFLDAAGHDYTKIATGHYAVTEERDGYSLLKRSPDPVKDQTYFLSHMSQQQVHRALFPIGGMLKREVRDFAHSINLPNKNRKDSQGICFLGKLKYADFVRHYLGEKPGEIIWKDTGEVLGEHKGYWFYTIGQRQGLGLSGGPWYVVGKDLERNRIYISQQQEAEQLARTEFAVTRLNWIHEPPGSQRLHLKLRHGPKLVAATVRHDGHDRLSIVMDEPDRGVASGQFAVFYDGEVCLGGGRIE